MCDPTWPCNMKSKFVSWWWQCPYQSAGVPSVHSCHGHRHLYVNWSRVWRPETARTCPEVSNKKNETHHQIRTTLFISSVCTHERKHMCVVTVLNLVDSVADFDEKLACQLTTINNTEMAFKPTFFWWSFCILKQWLNLSHTSCAFLYKTCFFSYSHILSHSGLTDFKQPVAKPTDSFNSSIPLSLEHHLIIPVIMPATHTVPPSFYNGIWPEQKAMFLLKCILPLLCVAPFLLSVSQVQQPH